MSLFLGDKKSQFSNNLADEVELEIKCTDQPFVGECDKKLDILVARDDSKLPKYLTFD
jgi:hypothetical protein